MVGQGGKFDFAFESIKITENAQKVRKANKK